MKNEPITIDGQTRWLSRSLAAVCYVFALVNGRLCLLANKRGPGTQERPQSNPGKWNAPSGFLDYDETLEQCACREVFEETGVEITPDMLTLRQIDSDPSRNNQTVLARFTCLIKYAGKIKFTTEHAEENEVEEIRWIPVDEIRNYDWVSKKHVNQIELYARTILLY